MMMPTMMMPTMMVPTMMMPTMMMPMMPMVVPMMPMSMNIYINFKSWSKISMMMIMVMVIPSIIFNDYYIGYWSYYRFLCVNILTVSRTISYYNVFAWITNSHCSIMLLICC